MPAPKRPNYFQSQFLIVRDFQAEQTYHDEMLRRHNLLMHDWGVVRDGLKVDKTGNGNDYVITGGSAIDSLGREIVLEDPATGPPAGKVTQADVTAAQAAAGANQDVLITITFNEIGSSDPLDQYPPPGGSDNVTRKVQAPVIGVTKAPAPVSAVILASIKPNGIVDYSARRLASGFVRVGDSNDLFIDAGRKLGIGTNSPQAPLHVKGNAAILNLEGGDHGFVQFFPKGFVAGRKGWLGFGNAGDSHLRIQNEATGNVLLSAQGFVGAAGSGGDGQGIQFGNREIKFRGDGIQHFSIFANKLSNALTFAKSGSTQNMDTVDANIMTLADTGNVGIGTTGLPAARLHLGSGALQIGASPNSVTTIDSKIIHMFGDETTPRYTLDRDLLGNGQAGLGFNTRKVPSATLAANGSAVGIPADRTLAFSTSDGTNLVERMRIDSAGNVSITNDLKVTGALSVGNGINLNNKPLTLRADNNGPDINHGLGYFGTGASTMGDFAMDGPVLYGSHGGALGTYGAKKVALRWDDSGNVGIGTLDPQSKLAIRGGEKLVQVPGMYNSAGPAFDRMIYYPPGTSVANVRQAGIQLNDLVVMRDQRREIESIEPLKVKDSGFTPGGTVPLYVVRAADGPIFRVEDYRGNPKLLIDNNGNVGIGTATPGFPLTFSNALGDKIAIFTGGDPATSFGLGVANSLLQIHTDQPGADVAFGYGSSKSFTETMRVKSNGNVGIGTTNPTRGKVEIVGSLTQQFGKLGYLQADPIGTQFNFPGGAQVSFAIPVATAGDWVSGVSLFADNDIASNRHLAFSDERLKHIQGRSDGTADLHTLLGIEVTDFRYKDVIGKGNGLHKKVIAQQVEKVFPQAVSKQTDMVPDIYQQASFTDGWIELATDLKKGERVKLITEKGEGVHVVIEVTPDKFRADFEPEGDQVFVFGREVNDFLNVDYDAIAMLNVSATQQLKKEKDEEVNALRTELAEQKAASDALISRLEILESKMAAASSVVATKNGSNGNGRH